MGLHKFEKDHQTYRQPKITWSWVQTAAELLDKGQYTEVANLLEQAQVTAEQTDDALLATVLRAAQQITLTCRQCDDEVTRYQRVYEETVSRERQLRQQLQALLCFISEHETDTSVEQHLEGELPESKTFKRDEASESPDKPGWWQRLQRVFGLLGAAPAKPSSEILTVSVETSPLLPSLDEQHHVNGRPTKDNTIPSPITSRNETIKGPSLAVYNFGVFRVYEQGNLIPNWSGNISKSIFKYMVFNRERPIHRETLMELFWPDEPPDMARRNAYQAIYMVRQALQSGCCPDFQHILCENSAYHFNPELNIWVDHEAFHAHYQTGQRLEREQKMEAAIQEYEAADTLYESDFLTEDIYEEWSFIHRENLKHAHLDILDRLSQHHFTHEQFALSIAYCRKILAEDNCREDAHRRLMRAYVQLGQRHLALRQFHHCVETLKQELDVSPMPATLELYQRIVNSTFQMSELSNLSPN